MPTASTPAASTPTPLRPAPIGRSEPRTSSGLASRRSTSSRGVPASTRSRSDATTSAAPGRRSVAAASRSTPTWWETWKRLPPRSGGASPSLRTTEVGQGPRTAFAQIAAEELRVPLELVTVHGADTRFTPYDRSTGASRSTTIAGLAVQRAAQQVREQLEQIADGDALDPGMYPDLIR